LEKIKLDIKKQDELIQNIQDFILKETSIEFSEIQAANLLNYILNEVGCSMYNQLLFETRSDMMQKFEKIFGIEKPPLQ